MDPDSVVCWVYTFVSLTASNSDSIFHSKSFLNQQYDFSSSLWVFLIVFNLWLSLHELRVCHQRIKLVSQSCLTLWTPWTIQFMEFSGLEYWSGSLSLLQGIFPTQGSNPGLPHGRRTLYQLSHKGGPQTLEWGACPFSSGSSQPSNQTSISCITGGSLPTASSGKPHQRIVDLFCETS